MVIMITNLFKVAFHLFVWEQSDGPHEISHQDEVTLSLQVQGNDIVKMTALHTQLPLSCPLKQPHLQSPSKYIMLWSINA